MVIRSKHIFPSVHCHEQASSAFCLRESGVLFDVLIIAGRSLDEMTVLSCQHPSDCRHVMFVGKLRVVVCGKK